MTIEHTRFIREYRRAVHEVLQFVTRPGQELIAQHNPGWHPDRFCFDSYLLASEQRYLRVVEHFNSYRSGNSPSDAVLDVGGFLAAFPLALARCGAEVTLVEQFSYYGDAFDNLAHYLSNNGVAIWAADFTQPLHDAPERRFDLVTAMAILEHLPNSPRPLMTNVLHCMRTDGVAAFEVPNIAYWPNRVSALKGHSVHQSFDLLYESVPPFTGHHREYTREELCDLLRWTGFDVLRIDLFNYTRLAPRSLGHAQRLRTLATMWPAALIESCREVILAIGRPRGRASPQDAP